MERDRTGYKPIPPVFTQLATIIMARFLFPDFVIPIIHTIPVNVYDEYPIEVNNLADHG